MKDGLIQSKIPERLKEAALKRTPLKRVTNAMRLVNGRGDRLDGLFLDQYNRHFVAQIFQTDWLKQRDTLSSFFKDEFAPEYLIVKDRTTAATRPEAIPTQIWIEEGTSQTLVQERGLSFEVDLNDTLNCGLFLDMRQNRRLVSQNARGRRVLNCFAYTCAFGLFCRAGEARQVINVDLSRKNLERGQRNYALNNIQPGTDEFTCADAVTYLSRAVKKDNRFDLIILDPPSFARRDGKVFSVNRDMPGLMDLSLKVLNPNGILFASTNLSEMSYGQLTGMVKRAAGNRIKKLEQLGSDLDFPGQGFMKESSLTAVMVKI